MRAFKSDNRITPALRGGNDRARGAKIDPEPHAGLKFARCGEKGRAFFVASAAVPAVGSRFAILGKNRRSFNMKMPMFALVLAIGMAFSAFAADEPPKIELEGVIQQ